MSQDPTDLPDDPETLSPGSPGESTRAAGTEGGGTGPTGISRRRLFAGTGAGVAVGAVAGFAGGRSDALGGGGGADASRPTSSTDLIDLDRGYDFYTGAHPTGIETEQQRYCVFMTFDLTASTSQDLQVLLARWSAAIAQLMKGEPVGLVQPQRAGAVASDTGEALDLGASSLTVTLGLGPGVFDERFGLADKRPTRLAELPVLPSDQLRPGLTGGDLSLQACADDPQVAYHAIRDLARMGRGTVNTRWTVLGFGRASAGKGQQTPRNLLGFKDGTRNVKEAVDLDDHVWVRDGDGDVPWMVGGSYQVARKIRMDIEIWDSDDVTDQQRVIGRSKQHGVPLTGEDEFDTPDFAAVDKAGKPVIDPRAHIALAAHENNGGIKILRRGYNFTDGINELGQLDAGLLFIAYMNDPASFVALQTKLGSADALNEYIAHIGSAVFAVPPAPAVGHYLAEDLFVSV